MRKLLIMFLISLILLCACENNEIEEPVVNRFSGIENNLNLDKDNYPIIDGSTANIPLAEILLEYFLDLSLDKVSTMVEFNTTDIAYENLANHRCDLVLAYEVSPETKEELGPLADFDYYEIGVDALVFLVNSYNPVRSLTTKELQDIYTGKIVNWLEVKGEDFEIIPYQRSKKSGSQTMMEKLVMKDIIMMERPSEEIETMSGLVDAILEYSNRENALGYSVYYYVVNMYESSNITLLEIDDIIPNNTTIADKTYPFINPFYAVVRKDEPENSPARLLAKWLSGPNGNKILELAGYVPAKEN